MDRLVGWLVSGLVGGLVLITTESSSLKRERGPKR